MSSLGKEAIMGLYKRNKVWWMRSNYNGQQVRKSTETVNKKLAEKIQAKVLTDIAEGRWFDRVGGKKGLSKS